MKRKELTGICGGIVLLFFAAIAFATPVPDTGQTKCYDKFGKEITCPSLGETLFGQDANFTLYPPSYTKLDSFGNALPDAAKSWAMVRDNVTGLVWEAKNNYDNYTDISNLHDADNGYSWYDPTDPHPGCPGKPPLTYSTKDFIDALNKAQFGGYSDWRIPTIKELTSLYLYSDESLAKYDYIVVNKWVPYWSSTTENYNPDYAWKANFKYYYGNFRDYKCYNGASMAVRGGQSGFLVNSAMETLDAVDKGSLDGASTAAGGYTDNGDGTVTDKSTGLMWQKNASHAEFDWEEALNFCSQQSTGGYLDWRMPTIKELQSLVDYSRTSPAINILFFPGCFSYPYWSSTTNFASTYTNMAFSVDFNDGSEESIYKFIRIENYVRYVRGGSILAFLSVSPTNRDVTYEKGTTTFVVSNKGTGTMQSQAEVISGNSWLYAYSGYQSNEIVCKYDANFGRSVRTGIIRVTAKGAIGSPKDVTVTQAGMPQASQLLGVWSDAIWAWNQATKQWTKIPSTSNAMMIAAGKVDSDTVDDLIGVWASGLWVRYASTGQWVKLSLNLPTWIVAGDFNNDGRDDVVGSWKNDGVYVRDSATGKWTKVTTPAKQLAAGNVCGHGWDDLVGVWDSGLWIGNSSTESWQKIDAAIPAWTTAGDMTGKGRSDVIGSYASGTWFRYSATGAWTKITTPAEQLAAGDIDGDGRDDLIGVWSNGVWVRYGATGQWQLITSSKPKWITTGRIAAAVQAAGSLDDPIESVAGMDIVDLSQEAPGGVATDGVSIGD
jgi:hypothetical protein